MSGAENAERLRALHRLGDPLLLANAWDPPSTRRLGVARVSFGSGLMHIAMDAAAQAAADYSAG